MKHEFSTDYDIGGNMVILAVTYAYVKGVPERGPTYACGGTPAEPPEVDVLTLEWSKKPGAFPVPAKFEWHKIEPGPLFDLIANDEWLYNQICDDYDGEQE